MSSSSKSNPVQEKTKKELECLIRRSPVLSDAAKLLWLELLRGWAWKNMSCYPSQETLAHALGWSVSKVRRRLAELVGFGLVRVNRDGRHQSNRYSLASKIPESICSPARAINTVINQGSELSGGHRSELRCGHISELTADKNRHISELRCGTSQNCDVAQVISENEHISVLTSKAVQEDEAVQKKLIKGSSWTREDARPHSSKKGSEKLSPSGSKNEPTKTPESGAEDDPRTTSDAGSCDPAKSSPALENKALMASTDIEGLMTEEDELPKTKKRKRSKKLRPTIVDPVERSRRGPGLEGIPSSEEPRRAPAEPVDGRKYVQGAPIPPKTPEDVLRLLRAEILEKYGEDAAAPVRLDGKEAGQIKNLILSKYDPDVVIAMVRLLVWDWEVVRTQFPYNTNVGIPVTEHLIQYRASLPGNARTGFPHSGAARGAEKTYASRYLKQRPVDPDNPFGN